MTDGQREGDAVVIPAVTAASSISCVRSLGRRGIHTIAASEDERSPVFSSKYCDEPVVVPSPADDVVGYKDALLSLARRTDVRAITPVREEDVYVLSRYRPEFESHVAPLWPRFETLRAVHDRVRLMEVAAEAGVSAPGTWLLGDVDDWDDELVVKGRYAILVEEYLDYPDGSAPSDSSSSGGCRDPGPTTYLSPGEAPDVPAIVSGMGHEPIVQEYVPGDEYAFWALYDRGEPVATCQRRRIRGYKYAGNASIFRETVAEPDLEAAGRALLDRLDWHGLAAAQFIRDDRTGEFRLMEVNPRFWLSVPAAVLAGADFPYFYWLLATGQGDRIDPDYEVGVATHLLSGEASYLHSVLRDDFSYVERPRFVDAASAVLSSLVAEPHFDYLCRDDPWPFVRVLLNAVAASGGRLPVPNPFGSRASVVDHPGAHTSGPGREGRAGSTTRREGR